MPMEFIKTRDRTNEFDLSDVRVSIDCNNIALTEAFEAFKNFLLACGYGINGDISIVNEDE